MYRKSKDFGFGELSLGNKNTNDFLTSVNRLLDWDFVEQYLNRILTKDLIR